MIRGRYLFWLTAAILGVSGAQAADDLPAPEPNFSNLCAVFGPGFHVIPGTETCIRISGRVRVDAVLSDGDGDSAERDRFTTRSRGTAAVDTRTQTDLGLFRTYIEAEKDFGRFD